jgi:glutaredoxin
MAKYLSGRVQRTPQSGLTSDRYSYLSLDQAEPNLGDPAVPGVILPSGVQYQLISVLNHPGERYWIPVGGGLIPGSISVYDEGLLVPPGGVSSITQLNFVGAAISASGYLDSYGNPGTISTITVFAPGNNKELIFNSNNEFSSSVDLTYDTNTGILTAARILNVGTGGTVFSTTGIGSVGIGTTNPTTKLHIVGDLRLTGTIYDYANNPGISQQILVKNNLGSLVWTSQGSIKAGAGGTFNQVQYHNSAGLVDGAANFVYDPITGNVGIGSTLPTYLLDVAGNTRITGITTLNKLYVTGISTFSSSADSTNTTSGALIISGGVGIAKNLNVGAVISTQSLNVTGQTTTQNLNVVGVSTLFDITGTSANFTGIVTASTFKGQISSGVGTITTFNSTTGIITALTGTAVTYTTGNITTLNGSNLYYNTGIITSLTSTNSSLANIISSGISTLGITTTTQLTARNLNVSGITTTQTLNVSGTSTFGGSIIPSATTTYNIGNINYKWNSLYVSTIVADQITGNTTTATSVIGGYADITSSNVSGISTTQYLVVLGNSSLGIATATSVTANTFTGSLNGNANTATKLATGRTIAITGDLAYTSPSFDGTVNVTGIGTLSNTGVTSATYGSSTTVPQIAIDAKGRITSASNVGVNFSAATVASADKLTTARTIAITGDLAYTSPPFDGTANVTGISTLANTGVVAATYGSSTTVPQIAIDAKGRITSASNVGVNFSAATVASADKLTTGRTISITGDLAYTSPSFDGTVNVTATGTLANTGVVAATYGSSTTVPQIIVDSKGRITSASNVGVNFSAATVASADKLTNGRTISITGDLTYTSPSFDGTVNVTATGTLASTGVVANTYGSGSQVPVFTVDSKGRITSVTNTSITGINASSVAAAGSNTQIQFNDNSVFAGNANLTFNKSTNTFATSIISASNSITAGTNTRYQIGNAYLSSGGDYAHLATHEWYNGSSWQTDSTPGGLFQITGQSFNWYKHNGTATHTLSLNLDSSGNLAATGTITGTQLISTVASPTAPLSVTSTTQVTNLNSNYLNGLTATQFFNNMGNNHGTRTDFNSITNFGFNYVQGSTNSPGIPSATQYYNVSLGLGNDYAYSQYAMEFAIPRASIGGNPYPSVRFREGGTWGSWSKIYAGYADSAGSSTNSTNAITATNLSGGSVAATTGTFSNYLRTLGQVRATGWYGTPTGSSYTGLAVEMGVSGGTGYTLCYNRDTSTYGNFNLAGASTNILLPSSGTTITVTGSISASGSVAGTNITSGGNVTGSSVSCSGNAATATNLSTIRTNWYTNGTISAVVGQLSWKYYQDNHTIFDASASTSPDGGAVNNTNSQVAWTSTYPTLMGWNGTNTFGVRVDSARIADTTTSLASLTVNQTSYSCTNPITTATGNTINIASSSNAYGRKFVQSTAPTSPCDGDVWYDTSGATATGSIDAIGLANQVLYKNASNLTTGSNNLVFDGTNLFVAGDITAYYTSDQRLKNNITPISNSLDKVLSISGNIFDWDKKSGKTGSEAGVIAQEIQKVLPQAVVTRDNGYLAVKYDQIIPLLIEAIKDLKEEINELKKEKDN